MKKIIKKAGMLLLCLDLPLYAVTAVTQDSVGWMGGISQQSSQSGTSQSWQVYFKKEYQNQWGFNLSYLNEGHFNNDFRDGVSLQGEWFSQCIWDEDLGFDVGVGPYLYFNTTDPNNNVGQYENQHGLALNTSFNATLYRFDPLLLNVSLSRIQTTGNNNTNMLMMGVSWDLDRPLNLLHLLPLANLGQQEVIAAYGRGMVDGRPVAFSPSYSMSYHYLVNTLFTVSVSYLNEGDNDLTHRQGINFMGWLQHSFYKGRLTFAGGVGPYFYKDTEHPNQHIAGIIGLATSYQITNHWLGRFEWDRVATNNNTDSDLYWLGVGYRF